MAGEVEFWQTPVRLEPFPGSVPARSAEDTVKALQADVRYIVTHTAIIVHVEGPRAVELGMIFNTRRGQRFPTGATRVSGGHVMEWRDLGAPQPGAPEMSLMEAAAALYAKLTDLGLEMQL